ncbi:hypothetical protein [Deinococcus sp. UYEF24]
MQLYQAQALIQTRTACLGISIQSLTALMSSVGLRWVVFNTEDGLEVQIFMTAAGYDAAPQVEFSSQEYNVAHALTHAVAQWFVLYGNE